MSSDEIITQSFLRFFEQKFFSWIHRRKEHNPGAIAKISIGREKRYAQYILVLQRYPPYTGDKAYLWAYLGA